MLGALFAIAAGTGLIALAIGIIPLGADEPPFAIKVFMVFIGLVMIMLAFSQLRLRMKRRAAYAGGRERTGTVKLLTPLGEESTSASLVFANSHSKWVMIADIGSIEKLKDGLVEGLPAKAYLGEDDRIYGLDIGTVKALPISPGVPYEGKLRSRMEWAERKKAEWAAKAAKE